MALQKLANCGVAPFIPLLRRTDVRLTARPLRALHLTVFAQPCLDDAFYERIIKMASQNDHLWAKMLQLTALESAAGWFAGLGDEKILTLGFYEMRTGFDL